MAINNSALKLLFLIILAENTAKLFSDFEGEGQSKHYVRRFFEELATPEQQDRLNTGIAKGITLQGLRYAIDFLYLVRSDVAYEGMYYQFHFREDLPLIVEAGEETATVNLYYEEVVNLVVNIVYQSLKKKLKI